MKYTFLVFIFISAISCQKEKKEPDYLLEKEKFVEVLTDFQMAEGIVRLGYNRTKDSLTYNDSVYFAVFRKYGISEAIFDSNFTYYSNKPEEFEEIFENVITNLSTKSAEIREKKTEEPYDPKK
jgi:hypothetical protein